ncbi:MAG: AEC family transporter, partial [Cyanobacteria bacterium J06659_2]
MTDTLFRAYVPLLFWPGLGLLLFRVLPDTFPRLLGRALYWVGVPLEIFSLIRRASLSGEVGLTPAIAVGALVTGLLLAELCWRGLSRLAAVKVESLAIAAWSPFHQPQLTDGAEPPMPIATNRAIQGSFTLAAMIGNTGFVGLAIAPTLVNDEYLSWLVFYSVAHNVLGSYGLGVFVASYFGRTARDQGGWQRVKDVLTVPSLWAFGLGLG